jgi:molecular chaperone GrpE
MSHGARKDRRPETEKAPEASPRGEGAAAVPAREAGETGAPPPEQSRSEGEAPEDAARLREEVAGLTDRWLRAVADLDNYKKRVARDRERDLWAARSGLLIPILGVLDDFERALGEERGDLDSFRRGVALIRDRFLAVLGEFGVRPFDSVGRPFDPERHDALHRVPSGDVPEGHVVAEIRRGYSADDRVLRPALVAVAAATESENVTD